MAQSIPLAVGCALVAGLAGAAIGAGWLARPAQRSQVRGPSDNDAAAVTATTTAADVVADVDSDEDSDVVHPDTDLKLVLLVREDLKMSKGKIAAQVGHAVLACYRAALRGRGEWREWVKAWLHRAQAKIALRVESEEAMDAICAVAAAAGLVCEVIEDEGRTEVAPGTRTVAGIGPCPKQLVDKITGPKGSHPLRLLA